MSKVDTEFSSSDACQEDGSPESHERDVIRIFVRAPTKIDEGSYGTSLEVIAAEFRVSRERARQMVEKALLRFHKHWKVMVDEGRPLPRHYQYDVMRASVGWRK